MKKLLFILTGLAFIGCSNSSKTATNFESLALSKNLLDYKITPTDSLDRSGLMFSDQGAWFAYSLPKTNKSQIGFTGPFLMTQQNGVWSSTQLSSLYITEGHHNDPIMPTNSDLVDQASYSSHLEQTFRNENLEITQNLVYLSGHTALQKTTITNVTESEYFDLNVNYQGAIPDIGITLSKDQGKVKLTSNKSNAIGYISPSEEFELFDILADSKFYSYHKNIQLKSGESKEIVIAHSFIFPEYSWEEEQKLIAMVDFDSVLAARKTEKNTQLTTLISNSQPQFKDSIYAQVLAKAHLTLQNNWRVPAGEIKHEGLFPSYHYVWFNGFWSWDSWKHAVGLSHYNTDLAKKQIKLMFEFQLDDGFVADCVYRDTLIEPHNWRDTKPPLSAWAVAKIYEKDQDLEFVRHMYPKLKKYHYWWYNKRDHDQDGICEYGSTDGTAIAAKWESGMDNAIRFDNIEMLENGEGAYSMNQESVDLNAYLYAEKLFLSQLADALKIDDSKIYQEEAAGLKKIIQTQFYDPEDGWFYDTNIQGNKFVKGAGSEGWTALWANAATPEQAAAVKDQMMNPEKFFTKVPFQTMSADHPKFDPLKGYWRGPNWFDQSYFGTKALRNYGYNSEADRATKAILAGAEGLLEKGMSIRENYHPLTGKGGHAKNFSWSAAHIIMMLLDE